MGQECMMDTSISKRFLKQQMYLVLLSLGVVLGWCVFPDGKFPSFSYGALSCWIPILLSLRLFVRWGRIGRQGLMVVAGSELVKVVLTILALLSAGRFLHQPSWLVVVAGFVCGQVLSWVAMWLAHVTVSRS